MVGLTTRNDLMCPMKAKLPNIKVSAGKMKNFLASFLSVTLILSLGYCPTERAFAEEEEESSEGTVAPAELPRFSLPAAGSLSTTDSNSEKSNDTESKVPPPPLKQSSGVDAPGTIQKKTPHSSIAISSTLPVPLASIYRGSQSVAQEIKLANGLRVLVLESHEFPVVSTLVWYRVGSRDEQTGAKGLCHMVEHLMFQEVGAFKPGDIGSMIARVGGQFNGYTSDDFTTFFETLPAGKLEMALKIESERMARVRFSQNEVQQEIANIQKEFENETRDPYALLSNEVRAMMFMQHPYHCPTLGWKTDVETLDAEHAKAFYEKYFHPDNATLVITGDIDPKQTISLVHKYFDGLKPAEKRVTHVTVNEPMPRSERRVNTKYAGNKEVLELAYRAPAMEDQDAPAMVVLERILNGGLGARLKSKLIESKLCSSAQASFEIKKEPGLFTITCTAAPALYNAQARILENLDSLIAQIREKPLSETELKKARNQAEFAYFAECDGPYRAGFHLGYFDSLDKWQNSYTWADRIRAVTAADLNRVIRKYLSPEARVVGWIAGTQAPKAAPPKTMNDAPKENNNQPSKHFSGAVDLSRASGSRHLA